MIFRELSNAAFCFSLRQSGAEIMGGAFKRPPPPAGGGKSRGPAGRGLSESVQCRIKGQRDRAAVSHSLTLVPVNFPSEPFSFRE